MCDFARVFALISLARRCWQIRGKAREKALLEARAKVSSRSPHVTLLARYSAGEICDGTAFGPTCRSKAGRTAVAACARGAPCALCDSLGTSVAAARGARHRGG